MTNYEWIKALGWKLIDLTANTVKTDTWKIFIDRGTYPIKVGTVRRDEKTLTATQAILAWLDEEHEEPILTEQERKYLETILDFTDRQLIYGITKREGTESGHLVLDTYWGECFLPWFDSGEYFTGLKTNTSYLLSDLGLE